MVRQLARGLAKQLFNLWLAVRSIGAHVAQIAFEPGDRRPFVILFRIERTIERNGKANIELRLQLLQHGSTGKAEINIQFRKMTLQKIVSPALLLERSDGDRSIDVIESLDWNIGFEDFIESRNAVGKIRAHQRNIGIFQFRAHLRQHLVPVLKNPDITIFRLREITVVLVPLKVVLKKHNRVAALIERIAQRAKCSGMAIAPRGGNGKAEHGEFQFSSWLLAISF